MFQTLLPPWKVPGELGGGAPRVDTERSGSVHCGEKRRNPDQEREDKGSYRSYRRYPSTSFLMAHEEPVEVFVCLEYVLWSSEDLGIHSWTREHRRLRVS